MAISVNNQDLRSRFLWMRRWISIALSALVSVSFLTACSSTTSSAPPPSVIATPVQSIQTSQGVVTYRSLGTGSPLVLVMGYASSQDLWPPDLVDALAAHHRVITFNNAGIGGTATLPGTLTITAMANQTAAFITAMHLSHPDVFGWSMGGMIAQALSVLHPNDVNQLVLGATNLGNGTAVVPTELSTFVTATENHDSAAVFAGLFPANQVSVQGPALDRAVKSYPHFTEASVAVDQAQWIAIQGWDNGSEPAGHGRITKSTLIGDGADDALIPPINSQLLHKAIPGSHLVLYPDAGHAFLFQAEPAWANEMNAFLG